MALRNTLNRDGTNGGLTGRGTNGYTNGRNFVHQFIKINLAQEQICGL